MIQQIVHNEPLIEYLINLDLPPARYMQPVIAAERACARELFDAVTAEFKGVPRIAIAGFGALYRSFSGPFQHELELWAEALGISFGEATLVNCAYELSHVGSGLMAWLGRVNPFGCTTAICPSGSSTMVHARNLDWPIPSMAAATRLLRFQQGKHEFVAVSFPLFVGVLSGMVPGEYSATINWAPPASVPDFHHGPAFLLRRTLQECRTYEAAVMRLTDSRLSTSVFFTLCGKSPGQACVIERTKDTAVVRDVGNGYEAQSNHHVGSKFEENNEVLQTSKKLRTEPVLATTKKRRDEMLQRIATLPGADGDLTRFFDLLSNEPITNEQTVQRMIFCPARGELHIDRRLKTTETGIKWGRSSWKAAV